MIKTAQDMIRALRRDTFCGVILYQGPSVIDGAPIMTGAEVVCPASEEAGKRTPCSDCRACGGTSAKARASIVIMAHGKTKARFAAAA